MPTESFARNEIAGRKCWPKRMTKKNAHAHPLYSGPNRTSTSPESKMSREDVQIRFRPECILFAENEFLSLKSPGPKYHGNNQRVPIPRQ